jgi:ribonuclease P protein component
VTTEVVTNLKFKIMKREFRLLKNYDFQSVIQQKRSAANKSFVVYVKKNDLNKMRVGVTVGNKYGCAVLRNKAKRQVREMVKDMFDFSLAVDIVIIIRKEFINRTFQKNNEELHYIYKKLIEKVD